MSVKQKKWAYRKVKKLKTQSVKQSAEFQLKMLTYWTLSTFYARFYHEHHEVVNCPSESRWWREASFSIAPSNQTPQWSWTKYVPWESSTIIIAADRATKSALANWPIHLHRMDSLTVRLAHSPLRVSMKFGIHLLRWKIDKRVNDERWNYEIKCIFDANPTIEPNL